MPLHKAPETLQESASPTCGLIPGELFFNDAFPFHVMRLTQRPVNEQYPALRQRSFWKLVYIFSGRGIHLLNGARQELRRGTVQLVGPADVTALLECAEPLHFLNVLFRPGLFNDGRLGLAEPYPEFWVGGPGLARKSLAPGAPRELALCFEDLEREYHRKRPGWQALIRLKLAELLWRLTRLEARRPGEGRSEAVLARLEARLLAEYHEPLNLPALAAGLGLHPNSLTRCYRRAHGLSLSAAWEKRRIEQTCELLLTSERPITAIAGEVGFNDLSFFYRVFRRLRGMAPGAWRAAHQAQAARPRGTILQPP